MPLILRQELLQIFLPPHPVPVPSFLPPGSSPKEEANITKTTQLLAHHLDLVLLHVAVDLFTLLSQLLLQASNQFSHLHIC